MMKKRLLLSGLLLVAGNVYGEVQQPDQPKGVKNSERSQTQEQLQREKAITPEEIAMNRTWDITSKVVAASKDPSFSELSLLQEKSHASLLVAYEFLLECRENNNCDERIDEWRYLIAQDQSRSARLRELYSDMEKRGHTRNMVVLAIRSMKK